MIDWKFWCTVIGLACVICAIEWFWVIPVVFKAEEIKIITFVLVMIAVFFVSLAIVFPEKIYELWERN